MDKIYSMKIHDKIDLNIDLNIAGHGFSYQVLRVPGGWIYTIERLSVLTSTFVRFDNKIQT